MGDSATQDTNLPAPESREINEGYFALVWRRFKKSKAAIFGGLMIIMLTILALFAEFFSPNSLSQLEMSAAFTPPSRVHFFDANGTFYWRPFTYNQVVTLDPTTFAPIWEEDTTTRYPIQFFVKGWEYKILGLIPADIHLMGVAEGGQLYLLGTDKLGRDLWGKACEAGRISLTLSVVGTIISVAIGSVLGVVSGYYGGRIDGGLQRFTEFVNSFPQLPLWMALAVIVPRSWDSFTLFLIMVFLFALLSWTVLAREVRSKVLAFRETDFVMAAREMGASDKRIIFLHLYPNTLSHIIVILTLTIPQLILAEAFLSFLGIGVQEPLVSWGLLMRNAQNIQVMGQAPWIMMPVIFIVFAVLGFNFLGDGLRDAADPYAIV